jgi:hypothetical protein
MHVHLRWYDKGQPGRPQQLASEADARAAILQQFPAATFSHRVSTTHQPGAMMLSGIDAVVYAYPGAIQPGVDPIADILFPAP